MSQELSSGKNHEFASINGRKKMMARRSFIGSAALMAAGLALGHPGKALAAAEPPCEPLDCTLIPCLPGDECKFPGYTLMMRIYGDFTFKELLLRNTVPELVALLLPKVDAASDILDADTLAQIRQKLIDISALCTDNPNVRRFFTPHRKRINNYEEILELGHELEGLGLLVPFIHQNDYDDNAADDALDDKEWDTLVHSRACGDSSLRDIYEKPFEGSVQDKGRRITAIRKAKNSGVFGPRNHIISLSGAKYTRKAYTVKFDGQYKTNNSACYENGTECHYCSGMFCSHSSPGGCSEMSDVREACFGR